MLRPALLLATALASSLALAGAAAAAPVVVQPAAQSFTLGSLRVTALADADNVLANDGMVFGLGVGPDAVAGVLRAAGLPSDKVTLSVDGLLVQGAGRVMLFDTGLGPAVHGALAASLAKAGVEPGAVTDVLITHSHGDHVGGLATADGKPAFPNAAIHLSAPEWAFMQSQDSGKALAAIIRPQVKPFEPGAEVLQGSGFGVTSVSLAGHTPGHSGYEIVSGTQHMLDMGDTAHSSVVSLTRPDWAIGYDTDKDEGVATRRAELARLAASHELVFAPHFPYPGVGRITASGGAFAWQPGMP